MKSFVLAAAAVISTLAAPAAAQSVYVRDIVELQRALVADYATCDDKGRFVAAVVMQMQMGMPSHLAQNSSAGLLHHGFRERATNAIYADSYFASISPQRAQAESTQICRQQIRDNATSFSMSRPWASVQAIDVAAHEAASDKACKAGDKSACADQEGAKADAKALGWCRTTAQTGRRWVPCEDMR